jgi:hypothetical protein
MELTQAFLSEMLGVRCTFEVAMGSFEGALDPKLESSGSSRILPQAISSRTGTGKSRCSAPAAFDARRPARTCSRAGTGKHWRKHMRNLMAIILVTAAAVLGAQASAQQPNQNVQEQADKGIKTQNSGASGLVADQEKSGASAHPPGQPNKTSDTGAAATAPTANKAIVAGGIGAEGLR